MNEQTTQAEPSAANLAIAVGRWIDEEFVRRFREEYDRAERAKQENNRRLEARLAELRAQRGAG
jgi:hypothetical protein